jgi:two-component system, OmpR family, phosphate regulon response regulator PhoB
MPTRVLVVEDDEQLRSMFRMALTLAGFETSGAADAVEALRRIDYDPPDAVILDIGLPKFSGALVREDLTAHAHTRDIPVLVVTASTENFDKLHANCVLRKPVHAEQIVEALRKCLDAHGDGQ